MISSRKLLKIPPISWLKPENMKQVGQVSADARALIPAFLSGQLWNSLKNGCNKACVRKVEGVFYRQKQDDLNIIRDFKLCAHSWDLYCHH